MAAIALPQAQAPKASERTRYERLLTVFDDLDQRGRLQQLLGRSLPLVSSIPALDTSETQTRPYSASSGMLQVL